MSLSFKGIWDTGTGEKRTIIQKYLYPDIHAKQNNGTESLPRDFKPIPPSSVLPTHPSSNSWVPLGHPSASLVQYPGVPEAALP